MLSEQDIRQIVRSEIANAANASQFQVASIPQHVHNGTDSSRISQEDIVPHPRANGSITMSTNGQTYILGITFNATMVWSYSPVVRRDYIVVVTAANATEGDVYSNNSQYFQVVNTIAGTTTLEVRGTGDPSASGTLTKVVGAGDATITFSSFSKAIKVRAFSIGSAILGPGFTFQPGTSSQVIPGNTQNITQSSSFFLGDSSSPDPVLRVLANQTRLVSVSYTTSGSALVGIDNDFYFAVTGANATIGAVYTNNGQSFVPVATISGGSSLQCFGTGQPSTSGTLTKSSGSGDATIAFSSFDNSVAVKGVVTAFAPQFVKIQTILSVGWEIDGNFLVL